MCPRFAIRSAVQFCLCLTGCEDRSERLRGARNRRGKFRRERRDGIAATELALCLPLLVTIMLATVEVCALYQLKQSLEVAAFEGARVGVVPDAKSSNINAHLEGLLKGFGVKSATISTVPSNPQSLESGDYLTVNVSAPFSDNSLIGGWFTDVVPQGSVSLRKD